jgi:hypothetical protein
MAMPSVAADLMWHDVILNTQDYQMFCKSAYGRVLHHRPAASMSAQEVSDLNGTAMATTFAMACLDQKIAPALPARLPVLFLIDAELGIPDGQLWLLDCGAKQCEVPSGHRCVRHELLPLLPAKLPWRKMREASGAAITGYGGGVVSGGGGCVSHGGGHGCGGHH